MKFRQQFQAVSTKTKNEFKRFVLSFVLAWICSIILNDIPIILNTIKTSGIHAFMQTLQVNLTAHTLQTLGFKTYSHANFLNILGTPGVRFEYGCLGFRHFSIFVFFILFHYGNILHKIWYSLLGIFILILTNILRASIICIGQYQNANNTELIHNIATPVFMYPTILFLWLIWISSFGRPKIPKP